MKKFLTKKKLLYTLPALALGSTLGYYVLTRKKEKKLLQTNIDYFNFIKTRSREDQIFEAKKKEFDLVVIGGGASGAGIALDATLRGLKVCLIEKNDFSSGTSSRSTKLVHGGVRYLEKAFLNFDIEQFKLVKEALNERLIFLDIAPHLTYHLPIMLPIYNYMDLPYFYSGCKLYDFLAGSKGLETSYYINKTKTIELFPMIRKENLKGSCVYYDGQHNDARMNITLVTTANANGCITLNYSEVVDLLKDDKNIINGVKVKDFKNGKEFNIKSKGVINATGPFLDSIRKLDTGKDTVEIIKPSSGTHIILPDYYSPKSTGLIDPTTSDARVLFFLPWENETIAGTTDTPCELTENPKPSEEDINYILKEISKYLDVEVEIRRKDIKSAWTGIRPLVKDLSKKNTESLSRTHSLVESENKLLSIAGGKWTIYRKMAEDTVDRAVQMFGLKPKSKCITHKFQLLGAENYSPILYIKLIQKFGINLHVAQHLTKSYGSLSYKICQIAKEKSLEKKLHADYPYIEAEIYFNMKYEFAITPMDVLARRLRLSFLDAEKALEVLPRVIDIMADYYKWSSSEKKKQHKESVKFLETMGLNMNQLNEVKK